VIIENCLYIYCSNVDILIFFWNSPWFYNELKIKKMRKIFTLLFSACLFISFNAQAQLADGSIAPNWTLTDIEGNEHTLYDYLDQGYVVFLDFSATWCGPCWSYHNSGALETMYHDYGPEGTVEAGRAMVFFIEGDANTTLDDIYGTGSSTQGDWTVGTEYPIIEGESITSQYAIGYWPTIYKVCPSRIITEAGQQQPAGLINEMNEADCQPASLAVDAGLISYTGDPAICGGSANFSITLMNFGVQPLTNATIEVKNVFNQSLLTTEWEGNLETYAMEDVYIGELTDLLASDFTVVVTAGEDGEDANNEIAVELINLDEDGAVFAAADGEETVTVTLELMTDNYGSETSWELRNLAGELFAQGAGYGNNTMYTEEIVLLGNDCYVFTIFDSFGDGICCAYGEGFYHLVDAAGNVLIEGGEFAEEALEGFKTEAVVSSVENAEFKSSLTVFPNPVNDNMEIRFSLNETTQMNVAIYNALGQQVQTVATENFPAGDHSLTVNATQLAAGMYFVRFQSGEEQTSRRFMVQH
jgi:thiol-disulfide isomerase/thioredoxin